MRNVNVLALSASDAGSTNGSFIDANQLVQASFHATFTDATAVGTFKLQGSNDPASARNMAAVDGFAPTNWVDIPSKSVSVTASAPALLTLAPSAYRWLRAVFAGTAPVAQVLDITTVADVAGSLNSTYFLLYSANNAGAYYVWFNVAGLGVDPAVPGKVGIEVDIGLNETADSIATIATGPIAAATGGVPFNANATTNHLLIYNLQTGPATPASDGAAPTGFSFSVSVPGVTGGTGVINVRMNAIGV